MRFPFVTPRDAPDPPTDYRLGSQPSVRDAVRTAVAASAIAPLMLAPLVRQRHVAPAASTTIEGLRAIRKSAKRALRWLGVDLEVVHPERVPREGGLVFMWNQESHLDHLVLGAVMPRPFHSLYNLEVSRIPLYGEYLRRNGHFLVDRTDESQWRAAVARAAARVQDGACVLVSPEGTRSWDGRLLPMKRGAFLLVDQAQRPIVCVTVIGGHARLPRGAWVVRPGTMRVVFCEPIQPSADMEITKARVVEAFEMTKRIFHLPA